MHERACAGRDSGAQIAQLCVRHSQRRLGAVAEQNGGYLRAGADQRCLQTVTRSGPAPRGTLPTMCQLAMARSPWSGRAERPHMRGPGRRSHTPLAAQSGGSGAREPRVRISSKTASQSADSDPLSTRSGAFRRRCRTSPADPRDNCGGRGIGIGDAGCFAPSGQAVGGDRSDRVPACLNRCF